MLAAVLFVDAPRLAPRALGLSTLVAVIVIGAVGLMLCAVFALLSAPDLALTQLLVEMVTIALMMMALNYLPKQSKQARTPFRRWRDAGISAAAGIGIFALAKFAHDPVAFVLLTGLVFFAWGEIYSLFPATTGEIVHVDGGFHAVDSSDMAFKSATRAAMQEALAKADPVMG